MIKLGRFFFLAKKKKSKLTFWHHVQNHGKKKNMYSNLLFDRTCLEIRTQTESKLILPQLEQDITTK
jgi:hypothetical protein